MSNELIDVIRVWSFTVVANIVSFVSSDIAQILPTVQTVLGIMSILLAMAYTLYKFTINWRGLTPWKKQMSQNTADIKQNTEDIAKNTKDIYDINKKY